MLLLDEPLGALDLQVRKAMQIELKRIQDVGRDHVRLRHARPGGGAGDVRPGRGDEPRPHRAAGTPHEIYDRPATEFVAAFIGDTNFLDAPAGRLAVRPESIRLAREGDGAGGTVVVRMVVGAAVQCVVRLDDGQEVLTRTQRSGDSVAEALEEGERVMVSWGPDAALDLKGGSSG